MFIILGCLEHFSNDQRTGSVWDVLDMRYIWVFGKLQSFDSIFFKGINSTQGWTATTRHGITRKKIRKRLNHTGNLFRRNVHLKGIYIIGQRKLLYKTLLPLFMDGLQLSQGYRTTRNRLFTFYHSGPKGSWYSLIRPWKDEKLSWPWSHPLVLNMGPLD